MPRRQKWFRMAYRPIETSLYRLHASRIFSLSYDRKWIIRASTSIETRILDFHKVAFGVWQKADNPVAGCIEPMLHRFIDFNQVVIFGAQKTGNEFLGFYHHLKYRFIEFSNVSFATSRRQIMSYQGHSTTWIIASSNSSKSHFWMTRRAKIIFHGLSTPRNIAFTT
jgi:hypothetical protein